MAAKESVTVIINEEEHSLLSEPLPSSALVAAEKKNVEETLNLESLVTELAHTGGFIRIAYNAIAAADPDRKILELKKLIRRLIDDIATLCSDSAIAVSKFQSTTHDIVQDLKSAYQYLLDGYDEMAIDTMEEISSVAKKMADIATMLHGKFKAQQAKVLEAVDKTMDTQQMKAEEREELKKKQEEIKRQHELLEQKIKELEMEEEQARKEREKYERKEDESIENISTMFTTESTAERAFNVAFMPLKVTAHSIGAFAYGRKAKANLKKEQLFQQEREERLQKQAEFLSQMGDSEKRESDYLTAIDFLHEAVTSLSGLSVVMLKAAQFWMQLHHHLTSLAENGMRTRVAKAIEKYEGEKKANFWLSNGFKKQAVVYYAKWVAIGDLCRQHLQRIEATQNEIYLHIKENPTREESRQQLPQLREEYKKDLEKEQKRIKESKMSTDAKIKMIDEIEEINDQ